jgi:hypothetical protein
VELVFGDKMKVIDLPNNMLINGNKMYICIYLSAYAAFEYGNNFATSRILRHNF